MEPAQAASKDPFAEWVLTEGSPQEDKNTPLAALDYLAKNETIFTQNPDWAKRMVRRLEMTDLAQTDITETGWNAYRMVFLKHPELFTDQSNASSMITITSRGQTIATVSKNRLMSNEFFRAWLHKFKTGEKSIDLEALGYDDSVVKEFVNYVVTGKINITGDNALDLFELADMYRINDLSENVSIFLAVNLDAESLPAVLPLAIKYSHLNSTLLNSCIKMLNDLGFTAKYEKNELVITLKDSALNETQKLSLLNALCKVVPTHLVFDDTKDLNDVSLESIISQLPDLVSIELKHVAISHIPHIEQFKKIDCYFCNRIEQIDAPTATHVSCYGCRYLSQLNAPAATYFGCMLCPYITHLNAPTATTFDCHVCERLEDLNAPLATYINARNCPKLKIITAPSAEWVNCPECFSLANIIAPKATRITCDRCLNLTSIDAPNLKRLVAKECKELTRIIAPVTAKIIK